MCRRSALRVWFGFIKHQTHLICDGEAAGNCWWSRGCRHPTRRRLCCCSAQHHGEQAPAAPVRATAAGSTAPGVRSERSRLHRSSRVCGCTCAPSDAVHFSTCCRTCTYGSGSISQPIAAATSVVSRAGWRVAAWHRCACIPSLAA